MERDFVGCQVARARWHRCDVKWFRPVCRLFEYLRGIVMAKQVVIEAVGLHTNPSEMQRPDGAMTIADNIIISRDGLIEPRKGFRNWASTEPTGAPSDAFVLFWAYRNGVVLHSNGFTGYAGEGGAGIPGNTGTITTESAVTWSKIGWFATEAAQNFYLGTDKGVRKRTSLTSGFLKAGAFKGPGLDRDDRVYTSAIGQMSLTSNVVTVNTSSAHGFYVGQTISQTSATEAPYAKGNYVVASVPSTTQFTYGLVAGDDPANANAHTFQPTQLDVVNGWLADGFQVAYRYCINYPDANNEEILSAPSPRCLIANTSAFIGYVAATAANPILRLFLPLATIGATPTNATIRVFRSKAVETTIEPSDEMGLVVERLLTSTDWGRGYVDVKDITPDSLRGETLYASPSQEGLLQSNDEPPLVRDATGTLLWDGSRLIIGGDTSTKPQGIFSILAVAGTNGIQNNQTLFGVKGVTGTPAAADEFKIDTSGTTAQNIRNTALNFCAAVNRDQADYYAYYISAANEAPGKILMVSNLAGTDYFLTNGGRRDAFFPKFGTSANFSLTRVSSTVTATVSSGTHSFEVGEQFTITNPSANFGAGPWTVLTTTSTTLTFTSAGSAVTASHNLRTFNPPETSEDRKINRVWESKPFMPEAFPALNYADVGADNSPIWTMAVVRNAVFAFKDDGLFIRTSPLTWELFDSTIRLVCPRSVQVLQNNIYAWTTQGVVAINDTGVEILSRPIEKTLNEFLITASSGNKEKGFAVAREKERIYSLYVTNVDANYPTQCFSFNTITRTWTREVTGSTQFYHGADVPTIQATSQNFVCLTTTSKQFLVQRNKNSKSDYHDVPGTFFTPNAKNANFATFTTSTPNFVAGDSVVSNQGNTYLVTNVTAPYWFMSPSIDLTETSFAKCTAINSIVEYSPLYSGEVDELKLFRSVKVLFQNCHAKAMTTGFTTELKTTLETVSPNLETLAGQWGGTWDGIERPYNLSLIVPQEMRRAQRINLRLQLNTALQVFGITGISLGYEVSGDKVSK